MAIVSAGKQSRPVQGGDGEQRGTAQVKLEEILKGSLPIDQTADDTAPATRRAATARPDNRYILCIPNAHRKGGSLAVGRWVLRHSADGTQLEAARKRWTDAITHQNPKSIDPGCDDTVYTA